jgi:hypothetical protein
LFDPPPDELQLIVISAATVEAALQMVLSCEQCCPDDAQIPFDWILDTVTGRSGATTDYILVESARCPNCKHEITEKTLVEPNDILTSRFAMQKAVVRYNDLSSTEIKTLRVQR